MKRIFVNSLGILLFFMFISCEKKDSLEDVIVNKKGEYWAVYGISGQKVERYFFGIYYEFHKDKTFKIYKINEREELNKIFSKKSVRWVVSKDSILSYASQRDKIITVNNNAIVLSREDTLTGNYVHVILIKERIDKNHKSTYYYEQKNRTYFGELPPESSDRK